MNNALELRFIPERYYHGYADEQVGPEAQTLAASPMSLFD